ncbi:MAG TPA: 50S ribosomal protein L11 methyltransferase [Nitrospirales bacterium]|nr:50S ribosomal protein L11 methyltransferase [Nitrospirales bacterium]
MDATVFEMTVPVSVDASELAGILDCQEFLGAWEAEGSVVLYWSKNGAAILQQVRSAISALGVVVPPEGSLQFQPVKAQDWNATWAASVQPIRIGRRIGIRPSWATMDMPKDGVELIIDPKQAFGTGHHATTQLILEWLEGVTWVPGMRVLDVGTGSGILAMAALRLGATTALGIDVDTTALDCAREYAAVNNIQQELTLSSCQLATLPDQSFDVILANLDRKTILQVMGQFSRLRGLHTQLVLSGLLEEDEAEIVGQLEGQGWLRRHVRRWDGWIAIQLGVAPLDSSSSG